MASLAEIRARLQAAETGKSGTSFSGDNAIYPHWNIEEGSTAKIRFLPDGNEKNTFFWVERAMIKLPFNGIKGDMDSKRVEVQVPCVEMWGEACPILAEVRTWFKDKNLEEMGRKYWKKRSYLFQGFVRENPLADDKTPENPIRRFIISPQIFATIKASLMDPELEELPTDYQSGLDFTVVKASKGGYADYSTSKWARKETALTSAEQDAVEKYGLFDLAEFLPKKPTATDLVIMKEMFEASVDGKPYDPEKWGQHYRPAGMQAQNNAARAADLAEFDQPRTATVQTVKVDNPVVSVTTDDSEPPFESDNSVTQAAKPAANKAEDILAMIRSRQKTA